MNEREKKAPFSNIQRIILLSKEMDRYNGNYLPDLWDNNNNVKISNLEILKNFYYY